MERRHSIIQVQDGDRFRARYMDLHIKIVFKDGKYVLTGTLDGKERPEHIFETAYDADLFIYIMLQNNAIMKEVD